MASLKSLIEEAGTALREIIIDRIVDLRDDDIGSKDANAKSVVTIPANLSIRVTRGGKIKFPNTTQHPGKPQLIIHGSFDAGLYPVFEFPSGLNDEQYTVLFQPGSVKEIPACWFGAVPNHPQRASSHLAIQRAIYAAFQTSRVYIPAGDYWLDDTIHLDTPPDSGRPFVSYVLEGSRPALESSTASTCLHTQFTDRPAINIGLARDTQIKNFAITGQNTQAATVYTLKEADPTRYANVERCNENIHPSDWISEGCTSGRHNPYCAIATDAYGAPPVKCQTYYGDTERYKTRTAPISGSSQVLIEGVCIKQFVVGIAISPGGAPQNDLIYVQRSSIHDCAYGISIGSTQSRGCHFQSNAISNCHTAIDNTTFGEEIRPGSKINCTSNIYWKCRNLYHLSSRNQGPAHLSGEYAENFIQLGHFGIGGNIGAGGSNIVFSGCDYAFGTRVKTMRLLSTEGTTTFISCDFRTYGDKERSPDFYCLLTSNSSQLVFQSCSFQASCSDQFPRFFTTQYADWHKIHFQNCSLKRIQAIDDVGCGIKNIADRATAAKPGLSDVDLSLSDNQMVFLADQTVPTRVGLHANSQTLSVRSYTQPSRRLNLKFSAPVHPFVPIRNLQRLSKEDTDYDYAVTFEPVYEGSFAVGDRIYSAFYLKEYPHTDECLNPLPAKHAFPANFLPLLEISNISEKTVTARIPLGLEIEVQLPHDFKTDQPYISIRPCQKNEPFVILGGSAQGKFSQGSNIITQVSGINLLRTGDFVNGEFAPEGTRIKAIEINQKVVHLTRAAIKSSDSDAGDAIPIAIAIE